MTCAEGLAAKCDPAGGRVMAWLKEVEAKDDPAFSLFSVHLIRSQ